MHGRYPSAAILMTLNAFIYSVMAAIIKSVAGDVPLFLIMFVSVATQFVFLSASAFRRIPPLIRSHPRRRAHLFRAGVLIVSMFSGFWAVSVLPLAVSTSISFSKALFVTVMGGLILKEIVGLQRWLAVLIGFSGILILSAQGSADGTTTLGVTLGVLSAATAALGAIWTRRLSQLDSGETLLLFQTFTGTLVLAPLAIATWSPPSLADLGALVGMGMLSVIGNLSMIAALRQGEASALAPIDFTRALFAGLLGWLVFSEVPTAQSWIGMAVILFGTLLSMRR